MCRVWWYACRKGAHVPNLMWVGYLTTTTTTLFSFRSWYPIAQKKKKKKIKPLFAITPYTHPHHTQRRTHSHTYPGRKLGFGFYFVDGWADTTRQHPTHEHTDTHLSGYDPSCSGIIEHVDTLQLILITIMMTATAIIHPMIPIPLRNHHIFPTSLFFKKKKKIKNKGKKRRKNRYLFHEFVTLPITKSSSRPREDCHNFRLRLQLFPKWLMILYAKLAQLAAYSLQLHIWEKVSSSDLRDRGSYECHPELKCLAGTSFNSSHTLFAIDSQISMRPRNRYRESWLKRVAAW